MGWGETLLGAGVGAAAAIYSARQANRFAERMSNTAHQREVADLRRAGLNPMISANRGASTPQGVQADIAGGIQRGASTGLAARMQREQIALIQAQTDQALASGALHRTQAADISTTGASGRYALLATEAELAKMTLDQKKELFPLAVEQAREEIRLTVASARQAEVMAALNEMLKTGRASEEKFAERIGEAGPAVRFLMDLVRGVGPTAIGAGYLTSRARAAAAEKSRYGEPAQSRRTWDSQRYNHLNNPD